VSATNTERGEPRVQCKTCPWRKGASVSAIPRYKREKHEALADTIAAPGSLAGLGRGIKAFACHYSPDDAPVACVGWVHNQLTVGNNLALRLAAILDPEVANVRVEGPQRERFEETFADNGRRRR
jgi:hypothetical protein